MAEKSSFGDRMKRYEDCYRIVLPRRMPLIIRLDGCAFHTYTKIFNKPWDINLCNAMQSTAQYLFSNIAGCKLAYWQSDEISLLLNDYESIETDAWFGRNLQKMVSVSASMASSTFNRYMDRLLQINPAFFDSRAYVLPQDEVCNYFLWRQRDCERNSINSLAQQYYSQKELHGKKIAEVHEMLHAKGINWNDLETWKKRGSCYVNGLLDADIPIFSQDRDYINQFVYVLSEK